MTPDPDLQALLQGILEHCVKHDATMLLVVAETDEGLAVISPLEAPEQRELLEKLLGIHDDKRPADQRIIMAVVEDEDPDQPS